MLGDEREEVCKIDILCIRAFLRQNVRSWSEQGSLWSLSPSAAFIFSRTKTFQSWKSAGAAQASSHSIAVLPFENASNDPNTEYLSEGISEALINSLTELQQLRVIARSTAFQYKGKDVDPRRVGRELQVAVVLTGKVRQMQDALSVQVDLVDASTGAQLWGSVYDRKIADLVAVKQAIAQEVTAKLKLKLSSEEQRRLVKRDSINPEAYQFYLRGRYFWNKRTPDGIKQAIEQFQQGIERDPNFALGHVGLADSYIGLTFYDFAAPHETMPKAKESAIKALALDNTVAEAHASLAHVLMNYDWNWSEAEKEFKRSIELKPDYATAHQWYAIHYLTATGRLEEAVQEMKKALELEPASLVMNTFMGATLYYAGRYDEAIDQCRRTIEMDPNFAVAHWHLGLAYDRRRHRPPDRFAPTSSSAENTSASAMHRKATRCSRRAYDREQRVIESPSRQRIVVGTAGWARPRPESLGHTALTRGRRRLSGPRRRRAWEAASRNSQFETQYLHPLVLGLPIRRRTVEGTVCPRRGRRKTKAQSQASLCA